MTTIRLLFWLAAAFEIAACTSVPPKMGVMPKSSIESTGPDTYRITARESRFGTEGDADDLFREAVKQVVSANHCQDYRILSKSRYMENALLGAPMPIVEGEILCLHHRAKEHSSFWGG